MFHDHLERWKLTPDGEPVITNTSGLLPVRCGDVAAMLKIALIDEEKRGGQLMSWWNGNGAAPVLACDENAILMERAEGGVSLADLARHDGDDAASRIICAVLARLHAPNGPAPPTLVPLAAWFQALGPAAAARGGILRLAAATASDLLATPRDVVALHGDMHHENVLRFGARGWLAIDPKGLIGERCFDYANILCNPDQATATKPGRLARQVAVLTDAARLERRRLLAWIVAWSGLSAAFSLDDGLPAGDALRIAELAAAELNR
ncbi:MAG TPA: aminoglycoside phosphotransferase family protein [Xanthobacteraceae bacterium]|jgi:streptomycin 6-kinase|nr:aminoglycoside phosphotransferase family protein [Xanthobacteraceae bacterium]